MMMMMIVVVVTMKMMMISMGGAMIELNYGLMLFWIARPSHARPSIRFVTACYYLCIESVACCSVA
jgi:hypothetical protein